jgi:hypothetical protein
MLIQVQIMLGIILKEMDLLHLLVRQMQIL